LIMSEVSVGNTPTRWRFLERNRLIAALARHTIVVEARWRSGALNTARHAMEIGRTLWAVPGQINSPNSVGTNRLLRDGLAQTLTEAADILEYDAAAGFELGTEHESEWDQAASSSALDELTERQGRVWDDLSPRSYRGVDEIAAALGLNARDVMADLFHLGRCGLAESSGTSWRKVRPAVAA
ncbi:MAG: DNA-processing protein DprA, partial [Rothia mucilaginosa]|nr:DNA-processing protein DprA [Rothia mucilaginosa]